MPPIFIDGRIEPIRFHIPDQRAAHLAGDDPPVEIGRQVARRQHEPAVAHQMRRSLIRYMKSDRFDPPVIENPEVLRTFVSDVCDSRRADATDIY